jgi:transposase
MWLLGRLAPDYKSIAEFRRMHREAATEAGAALVGFARSAGLVRGEWIAIDGSKFQAASSARGVREREAVKRYLEQLEQADEGDEMVIDPDAVATALEKLNRHAEPEAHLMRVGHGHAPAPAYNVQTAVDAEHALIAAQQVTTEATDNRSLLPMAQAAKQAVGAPDSLNVVADAGNSTHSEALIFAGAENVAAVTVRMKDLQWESASDVLAADDELLFQSVEVAVYALRG